jgi:predicted amidohydrolase
MLLKDLVGPSQVVDLAFVFPVADSVLRATSLALGSLAVGRPADITVFSLDIAEHQFEDSFGNRGTSSIGLRVHHTIRGGIPWFSPMPHPGRGVTVRPD